MEPLESCYFHPAVATGVHCSRCGRPVCPACMTAAPVGHHCPTCMGEARVVNRATTPRPQASLGGRVMPVTATLIAVNVVAYLAASARGRRDANILRFGQSPYAIARSHEYYRLLTGAFLHVSLTHLLFNMVALLLVGSPLEAALGRIRFVALYLVAALGGSVCSYLFGNPRVVSVGASGAVFGLFGAFFVVARARRADTSGILVLIGINLALSFADHAIDWRDHVGGLVVGGIVGGLFVFAARRPPAQRRVMEWAGVAATVVVLAALASVRTGQLRA